MSRKQPYESYVEEMEKIYRVKPYLGAFDRKRLYDLSRDLRKKDIDYETYFERLAKGLIWFVDGNKLKYIPVNMICGEWALKYYKENFTRTVVMKYNVDMERVALLHNELLVANALLSGVGKTYEEVAERLTPMLPANWLTLRQELTQDVVGEVVSNLRCRYRDITPYENLL